MGWIDHATDNPPRWCAQCNTYQPVKSGSYIGIPGSNRAKWQCGPCIIRANERKEQQCKNK